MKLSLTYTLSEKHIPKECLEVFRCYGNAAKNIKNSALFMIKNILSSYLYDKASETYTQKKNLHENQIKTLEYANKTIQKLNEKRLTKFTQAPKENKNKNKDKTSKSKKSSLDINHQNSSEEKPTTTPKEKTLQILASYGEVITKHTYYQILQKSVLENTLKTKESHETYKDYTEVNSHLAQSVVQKLCDDYSHYFKALASYYTNPAAFTGKPNPPDYHAKTASSSFELSHHRFGSKGTVLTITQKHKLFKDYNKTQPISDNLITAFNAFNLRKAITEDMNDKKLSGKMVSVRVVPTKTAFSEIQYVISHEKELKGFFPELLEKALREKEKPFFDLKNTVKMALMKDYFKDKPVPSLMALDCGVVNFVGVGIFTAHRDSNTVISGNTLKNKVRKVDAKIDKRKADLASQATPEIRDLMTRDSDKEKKTPLSRNEWRTLSRYYKDVYADQELQRLQERKANIIQDYFHKTSKALIELCRRLDIKVIVVGKNPQQKQYIHTGRKNNRDMYNFAHVRFIEILKYKGMLNDILVIETEESYTSKTSFIDHEELRVHGKTTHDPQNPLSGKRIDRVFITKNHRQVHADINGAFNIARKVFALFAYDKTRISMAYQLVETNLHGKKKLITFCGTNTANPYNNAFLHAL